MSTQILTKGKSLWYFDVDNDIHYPITVISQRGNSIKAKMYNGSVVSVSANDSCLKFRKPREKCFIPEGVKSKPRPEEKPTVRQVLNEIMLIRDMGLLNEISVGLRDYMTLLARQQFRLNQKVRFTAKGFTLNGVITKINPKKMKVFCSKGRQGKPETWLIPPSYLQSI